MISMARMYRFIWVAIAVVSFIPSQLAKKDELENSIREILNDIRNLEARMERHHTYYTRDNVDNSDSQYESEARARNWLRKLDPKLAASYNVEAEAGWNYLTNLTDENANKLSEISVRQTHWQGQQIDKAKKFLEHSDNFQDQEVVRLLETLVTASSVPVAKNPETVQKISTLGNQLEGIYGNAQADKDGKTYHIEPEFSELMAESRDYDELLWGWITWRDITGPQMCPLFSEMVSAMNEAATDNGYHDVGVSWRMASYGEDNIEDMVDDLYEKVAPLYRELHAYVRRKLVEYYSDQNLDPTGPIEAHLLGNMWAQEWENIIDIVVPYPHAVSDDVSQAMVDQGYTTETMFRTAESFFTSIGLEPMTDVFWEKSVIAKPDDRPIQCHASAEDFTTEDDFRIKMCTEVTQSYLQTVHHEMGHVEYYMQYRHQPTIFRNGANAAFHEAVGDTIALSVMTPQHLNAIGLLGDDAVSDVNTTSRVCIQNAPCGDVEKKLLNSLMGTALSKIAFLPFGYLIDKWRWEVFRGNIDESNYNSKWWEFRTRYQGIVAPVERSESDCDPLAKYHVAANVPYIRYFLSFIGQFQFHEALCKAKNHQGPLHTCDIYESIEAGNLLKSALDKGSSLPWRDTMEILTGQRDFDTRAIFEYFDPLYQWLKEQNAGETIGW